jgi:hypothetical protein
LNDLNEEMVETKLASSLSQSEIPETSGKESQSTYKGLNNQMSTVRPFGGDSDIKLKSQSEKKDNPAALREG